MHTQATLLTLTCVGLTLLVLTLSCGRDRPSVARDDLGLTARQLADLASKRVFFGHKSVGDNLVQGLRELMAEDSRIKLNIVRSEDPHSFPGGAFVESYVGNNRDPRSKDAAFAAILEKGWGAQGGIALYKYCYVDIDAATDAARLFESYRSGVAALEKRYPSLKLAHVTVPLSTVEPRPKAWLKSMLGKPTLREANARRNAFNRLLRQTYQKTGAVFDLAAVESTRPDGSRTYFTSNGERVYTLAPEYTSDGGHLNAAGRRAAAKEFLRVLAAL